MNLEIALKQAGHSGIISGFCCIHYEIPKYNDVPDFLRKNEDTTDRTVKVEVTFSHGIVALGTYVVRITGISGNQMDGELYNGDESTGIVVTINYTEADIAMATVCTFCAVHYKN